MNHNKKHLQLFNTLDILDEYDAYIEQINKKNEKESNQLINKLRRRWRRRHEN